MLWGGSTIDIYLNNETHWSNVPEAVWEYTIGGYLVLKKWLSYREEEVLRRPITKDEAREFRSERNALEQRARGRLGIYHRRLPGAEKMAELPGRGSAATAHYERRSAGIHAHGEADCRPGADGD